MGFEYSKYQKDIFEEIKNKETNIMIEAKAGSGKSSTIVKSLEYVPKYDSVLFLAFNKSIVEELKPKVKGNVEIKTLHSLGLNLIRKNTNFKLDVNKNKFDTIFEDCILEIDSSERRFTKEFIKNSFKYHLKTIISLIKSNNVDYNDIYEITEIMNFYDLNFNKFNEDVTFEYIKMICNLSLDIEKYGVDFDDMIWIPNIMNYKDYYNYVYADECQDFNKSQMNIIKNITNDYSRIITVGDRKQSILGFAGSNTNSVDDMIEMFNMKVMPLSISYRCPKSHIKLAQTLVPDIEHYEENEEGEIKYICESQITSAIESSNDMIICRTTSPLVDTCLFLIKNGKKAFVKGSDLKKLILSEITKEQDNHRTPQSMKRHFKSLLDKLTYEIQKLDMDMEIEVDKVRTKAEKEYVKRQFYYKKRNIFKRFDIIRTIIIFCGFEEIESISQLKSKVEEVFEEKKGSICCSTIHKAKGLEADNIILLHPHLIPHPVLSGTTEWQKEQEDNVLYVALTRAKKKLTFARKIEE